MVSPKVIGTADARFRNRLFKPRQYCLWLGETRILGVVQILYQLLPSEADELRRDHPLDYPPDYEVWEVDIVGAMGDHQKGGRHGQTSALYAWVSALRTWKSSHG